MAVCQNCKAQVADGAKTCPMCGKEIAANTLENIQTETGGWQKFIIIVTIILLIAIGFTYYGAEDREDKASQQIFSAQMPRIVQTAALQSGLARVYGMPGWQIAADPKAATVILHFPSGPLTQAQASQIGQMVAADLAQTYVNKGYMPRNLRVVVGGTQPGGNAVYGQALYNGDYGEPGTALSWQPASY